MNTAQKRGSSTQRLKWGSETGTLRQPRCSYVSLWGGGSEAIPSVILCQNRDSDRQGQGVSPPLPLHALVRHALIPARTCRQDSLDLPLLLLCPGRFLIQSMPTPTHWTEREGMDRSHLYQTLPRKTFSHRWHSHTRWLPATLAWRPQHTPPLDRTQPMPATKFHNGSMKAQSKPTEQNRFGLPFPVLLAQNNPLDFTPQKNDAVNTTDSKKPFLYFYLLEINPKQNKTKTPREKAKCFQEFSPSFLTIWLIWLLFEFHLRHIFAPI